MIGIPMTSLSFSIALVVAVLHATTIALQFNSISFSQFLILKEIISFFDLYPYGQFLLSAKNIKFSFGNNSFSLSKIDIPPIP